MSRGTRRVGRTEPLARVRNAPAGNFYEVRVTGGQPVSIRPRADARICIHARRGLTSSTPAACHG